MAGRISQFFKAIKDGLVTDVPPEYQACESCREVTCDTTKANACELRAIAETQELEHRSSSGFRRITDTRYDVDQNENINVKH